jgi:hypothetical protein
VFQCILLIYIWNKNCGNVISYAWKSLIINETLEIIFISLLVNSVLSRMRGGRKTKWIKYKWRAAASLFRGHWLKHLFCCFKLTMFYMIISKIRNCHIKLKNIIYMLLIWIFLFVLTNIPNIIIKVKFTIELWRKEDVAGSKHFTFTLIKFSIRCA